MGLAEDALLLAAILTKYWSRYSEHSKSDECAICPTESTSEIYS